MDFNKLYGVSPIAARTSKNPREILCKSVPIKLFYYKGATSPRVDLSRSCFML